MEGHEDRRTSSQLGDKQLTMLSTGDHLHR